MKKNDKDRLIYLKLKKFIKLAKPKRISGGQWYYKNPTQKTINSIKSDELVMGLFREILNDSTLLERLFQKYNIKYDYEDYKTISAKVLDIEKEKFFGFITGKENLIFPYGSYTGKIKNGKPHGKGVFNYFDGAFYKGHFYNGKYNGFGTLIWPENNVMNFEGGYKTWKKSSFRKEQLFNYKKFFTKMHGYGLFLNKNDYHIDHGVGGKFVGNWNNNYMIDGTMYQYTYSSLQNKYVGTFKNFNKDGYGIYTMPSSNDDDKKFGYVWSYKGEFKNDSWHGKGKSIDTMEDRYYLGKEFKRVKGDKIICIEDGFYKNGFQYGRSNWTIMYFNSKGIKKFTKYAEVLWSKTKKNELNHYLPVKKHRPLKK